MFGYFGLSGEGPTEAFIRASAPSTNVASYIDDLQDNLGDAIGYTRVRAEFVPCHGSGDRDYKSESRGWLTRLFVGLKTEKILTIRVTVSGDFDEVSKDTILASISRTSSKTGDEWATHVAESTILLPYFRVGQRTSITVAPTFFASSDYSTSVASDVLAVVENAAAAINPTSTLITSENQPQFNRAANFVDKTVSGVLHRKIGEDAVSVRDLHDLQRGGEIARILLLAPAANYTVTAVAKPLGVWIIRAEPMIKSVFGPETPDGRLQLSSLSAKTILTSTVAEGKNLGDSLLASTKVSGARDAYLKATKPTDIRKTGAQFCNAVSTEAAKMWFTPADVGAIVWAMATDLAPEAASQKNLLSACDGIAPLPK
jgi:hypothetical protein